MKIVHISDLHFGRENPEVVAELLKDIHHIAPSLVIVSGDLTQRARRKQFQKAADFLKQIAFPKLVVPGNHDVPLFDVTRRFLAPFTRYVRYINDDFFPTYQDDYVTAIGINTAYSFTWKSGRVTPQQMEIVAEKFKQAGPKIKLLVVHHPFHEVLSQEHHFPNLNELKIDMILSGHLHQSSAELLKQHITRLNYRTLLVQAGTAVSTRLRKENNAYNVIEVASHHQLTIKIKVFDEGRFALRKARTFIKEQGEWLLQERDSDQNKNT